MIATRRVDDAQLGVFNAYFQHIEQGWKIIQAFPGEIKRELQTNGVPPVLGKLSII